MIRVGLLAEKADIKYNPSVTNPNDLVSSIKNLGFGASLVDTVNTSEGKIELMVITDEIVFINIITNTLVFVNKISV